MLSSGNRTSSPSMTFRTLSRGWPVATLSGEDPARPGQDRMRAELPEEPGTGFPQVERGGGDPGRRLLRAERPGYRKALPRQHEGIHPNSVWVVAGLLICTASLTHAQYCDMSMIPINMKLIPMRTAHARSRVSNSPAIPLPTALYGAKFRCCQTRGFVPKLLIGRRFLPAKERISEAELDFSLLSGKAHSSDPPVCRGACAHRYCL
jgi:hypothetical protein